MENKKFYCVECKGGHVGQKYFYRMPLYLEAASGKEAAEMARRHPRAKHDHKDCILSVTRITREEYERGKWENARDPYFTVKNVQEQRKYKCIYDRIEPDTHYADYKHRYQGERKSLKQRNPKRYAKMQGIEMAM